MKLTYEASLEHFLDTFKKSKEMSDEAAEVYSWFIQQKKF